MTLPNGFDMATDAAFRLVAGFTEPPKPGVIVGLEMSGQYVVDVDDGGGGSVLAWPLNGFDYAIGSVVYVLFAANAPESGIILGSLAPLPTLAGGAVDLSGLEHSAISGLGNDDHIQYLLLAGRSGQRIDDLLGVNVAASSGAQVYVVSGAAGRPALVLKAAASPSADLFQLLFNDDSPVLRVPQNGVVTMPFGWRSYVQSIADDSVYSFTPLGGTGAAGMLFLTAGSQANTASLAAVITYRATTTPFCSAIAAGANINTTTGVLTGTTGTDGRMTVSAASDGTLYVENRMGATREMRIGIMG